MREFDVKKLKICCKGMCQGGKFDTAGKLSSFLNVGGSSHGDR